MALYLDAPVVRFYRAMGPGYRERINRLLATWMHMKLAEELELERVLDKRMGREEYVQKTAERKTRPSPKEEIEAPKKGWLGWIEE